MSDNKVLKYVAPKMPRIILKRAEEIFPALKENLVCCTESSLTRTKVVLSSFCKSLVFN